MGDRKRILVIDDDPGILESVRAILEGNGYAVDTAISGEDGIRSFQEKKPDLVLCDMMMERIDEGTKVAAHIKKSDSKVPVFLLSSISNATASNIELDKIGFDGEFQKPIEFDIMLQVIATYTGK
jgi:CheY-like chemotaxis protein